MTRIFGMLVLFSAVLWVAAATSQTITTRQDCASIKHKPSADVAVKDGVDAQGWAVAPADLDPPALTAEDFNSVHVGLNIPTDRYTNDATLKDSRSDIELGSINVTQD